MRLRQILRRLIKLPMFTSMLIATLAIGIGANTATFSVVQGILLKPPPYPNPDELITVDHAAPGVNPNLPLASVQTLQEIYDKSLARTSFTLVMLGIAGAMALLVGLAGIYGVISYSVSQRTREIGIRVALGAKNQEVTRMFVGYGLRLAVIGVACGLAAAFATTRLLSSLLFNVSPMTSINPVEALRAE